MRKIGWVGLPVLAVMVVAGAYFYFFQDDEKIQAIQLEESPLEQVISATGKVTPARELEIRMEVTGTIEKFPVDEGDYVQKGDLLAAVDDSDIIIQLQEARVSYQSALAQYDSVVQTQISMTEEDMRQLEIDINSQENLVKRQEKLYEEGAVSLSSLENARQQLEILNSRRSSVQKKLESQSPGGTALREAEAGVEKARTGVTALENELDKFNIHAPINGRVADVTVSEGQWVSSGTGIFKLLSEEQFYVEVDLDESYIGLLETGQSAKVWTEGFSTREMEGTVERIGSQVDNSTGTVPVRVRIDEVLDYLIKDLTVQAEISVRSEDDALIVPVRYLMDENPYEVLLWEENSIKTRKIAAEPVDISRIYVLDGLEAGDIILDPSAGLKPGTDLARERISIEDDRL